ncbi:hypothetical protein N7G274_009771 [Stereocaulon virgatum]|uniref:Uncharacterized protein n=1 Tax=Stereocaulon virgatum TaxID=373712 RepID=A0ABR3ZV55_9LECA
MMTSGKEPSSDAEQLLKQLSKAPTILTPALKVGALTGTTGLLTGGITAVLRASPTPTLFTIASGIQWFALGSTFWATRSTILYQWNAGPLPSSQDRVSASSYAGGITGGMIGALFRGRRNIIPGTMMFALFGFMGQTVYNKLDARHTQQVAVEMASLKEIKTKDVWNSIAEMKWMPMRALSDEEYGNMLRERLLRVEADIALVDEEMERLRVEESRIGETQGSKPSDNVEQEK